MEKLPTPQANVRSCVCRRFCKPEINQLKVPERGNELEEWSVEGKIDIFVADEALANTSRTAPFQTFAMKKH